MADARPFRGALFDPAIPLSRVLCPPYDVIGPEQARQLRRQPLNAIHLELPEGQGPAKYRNAARTWKRWQSEGVLRRDPEPAIYVCEESFRLAGLVLRRRGFLAALGVTNSAAGSVMPHERTLAKPKADRLRLLKAVRANISPIFGIFPDAAGRVRRIIIQTIRRRPDVSGKALGFRYRLWRVSDPRVTSLISRALDAKTLLIADGHHRYEVARRYYAATRLPEADAVLAYLCPEEDAGLVVLPTHRVVTGPDLLSESRRLCRVRACPTRRSLLQRLSESRNPYAYGVSASGFFLAEPRHTRGCRSGLCVEWLGKCLLRDVPPESIAYTPDAAQAEALSRSRRATAVFVKPLCVAQIRRAVRSVGLLPPKSTYFYPKVPTGLAFKPLDGRAGS